MFLQRNAALAEVLPSQISPEMLMQVVEDIHTLIRLEEEDIN